MLHATPMILNVLALIGSALWVMLPAYLPNNVAAVAGGGIPMDLGRSWTDGRRIFGDGKTIRGFVAGVGVGIIIGAVQMYAETSGMVPFFPPHTLAAIVLLPIGSLLGDMVKSFFKRRRGIERGGEWPLVDQYDFVVGALVLTALCDSAWFFQTITLPLLIVILVLTPILHRTVNIIGYKLGVKKVPW